MTRLQHNGKPGHANTSLCFPKQIQIMSEAGFCLFIGNITVKLLLLLAATARGYSHTHAHAEMLIRCIYAYFTIVLHARVLYRAFFSSDLKE